MQERSSLTCLTLGNHISEVKRCTLEYCTDSNSISLAVLYATSQYSCWHASQGDDFTTKYTARWHTRLQVLQETNLPGIKGSRVAEFYEYDALKSDRVRRAKTREI